MTTEDKRVPFVNDDKIDSFYGTGMFPICPGLHLHDYVVARDNDLERNSVLDKNGKITEDCNVSLIAGKNFDDIEEILQLKFYSSFLL